MKHLTETKRLITRTAMAERALEKARKDTGQALEHAFRVRHLLHRNDGSESELEEANAAIAALTTMMGFLRRAEEAHADAKLHSHFLIGE